MFVWYEKSAVPSYSCTIGKGLKAVTVELGHELSHKAGARTRLENNAFLG